MKDMWNECPVMLRKIILIEVALLVVLAAALAFMSIAWAETYTCVVHRGEWVWIRDSADKSGRQIGRVRFGYEVEAEEPINGYFRIETRSGWMLDGEKASYGYVDASYFDREVPETMYMVNTQGGPLAKRETPDGRLLCWIKPGVKISVLGWRYSKSGELWAKVYHGGYVAAKYLAEL